VAKDENEDHGVEIEIELEKGNDGTVHPDAKGCMLHEDKKKNGQDIGIDYRDARGYMPPKVENSSSELIIDLPPAEGVPHCDDCVVMCASDKDKDVIQLKNVASGRTEAHGEMESKVENSSSEIIIDLPPAEGVPHCDDCVVMCASMSGKCFYFVC
jgi:hypothetical protein